MSVGSGVASSEVISSRDDASEAGVQNSIQLRAAKNEGDISKIVEMSAMGHQETLSRAIPFEEDVITHNLTQLLEKPKGSLVLMAELKGKLLGFLVANAGGHFYSRELGATCLVIYVLPEHRGGAAALKMIHAFKKWAQNRNIKHIYFNVASGIEVVRSDKMFRRLGFSQLGGSYMATIKT